MQNVRCAHESRLPKHRRSSSRGMSLVEAIANVAVGYAIAVLTQMLVFPIFGLQVSLADNLAIGLAFTGISLTRSYLLRRLFEAFRVHGAGTITAGQVARRRRSF